MQQMMKQAQKMQKQLEKKQAELAETNFTGDKKLVSIDYKEAVVDPEDVETLQDMTAQAINDALSQIDEATIVD